MSRAMKTTPTPAAGSLLTPIRMMGTTYHGTRAKEVWDCKCKCGRVWAVLRDHLVSGREAMCGTCKGPKKRRVSKNVQ